MRPLFILLLFFRVGTITGQVDSLSLKKAMSELDAALITKNENQLGQVLHNDASFGHSNGWVQTKADIINDLKSGKLVYNKIENSNTAIVAINNNWATVRINTNAEGSVNGTAFQLKLHVLQVWTKATSGWQLLARQSTKL